MNMRLQGLLNVERYALRTKSSFIKDLNAKARAMNVTMHRALSDKLALSKRVAQLEEQLADIFEFERPNTAARVQSATL